MSADEEMGRGAGAAVTDGPSSRRTLADIGAQVVGRLANGMLGVVVIVIVARGLGTEDFGRWSTLLTVIGLAGPLTELGITQVAVARSAAHPEDEGAWLGALLVIRVVLGLVAASVCVVAVLLIGDDLKMRIAGVLLAATVLLGGVSALAAVFQLRTRNDLTVLVITVNSVLWTAGVVIVGVAGGGLVALAVAFLVASIASIGLQSVVALRRMQLSFEDWRGRGRELIRVGLPLSIGMVLVLAYAKADQLLVFSIAGERDAGLYGAAYRILDQASVVPLSVITTLYPLLVRAHATDPERLRFVLQRALEALLAVGLGALAFAVACGGEVLGLLFGAEFEAAGPTLAILMGVLIVVSMNYLNAPLVLVLGLQSRVLVFSAVGLVVNIALNVALIPSYGYVAAAWATFATELVVVVLTSVATLRLLAWHPQVGVIVRAVLAAVLTGLALEGLGVVDVPIGALLVLTPVLYGGLIVVLGGLRVAETIALVRPGSAQA